MSDINQQTYYALKTLRGEARLAERNAEREGDARYVDVAMWRDIIQSANAILQQDGNDINVVCWLIEGLVRVEGFAGFASGINTLQDLLVRAWPDVTPAVEDEDPITKLDALVGLDGGLNEGALIKPLRLTNLTEETKTLTPCALWQFQQDEQEDITALNQLVRSNNQTFLETQKQTLEAGLDALNKLHQWLEDTFGNNAPVLGNIRAELKQALDIIDRELQRRIKAEQDDALQAAAGEGSAQKNFDENSREQLFEQLERIADIFAEREPHSPIPTLLQQAVRWGHMDLAELMQEMLQGPGAYQEYCRSAGFAPDLYARQPEIEMNHSFDQYKE